MTGKKLLLWLFGLVLTATVIMALNYQWLARTLLNQALEPHQIELLSLNFKLTDLKTISVDELQLENQGNQLTLTDLTITLPVPLYRFSEAQLGNTKVRLTRLDLDLAKLPETLLSSPGTDVTQAQWLSSKPWPPLPSVHVQETWVNLAGLPLRLENLKLHQHHTAPLQDKHRQPSVTRDRIDFSGVLYPAYLSPSQQLQQEPLVRVNGKLSRSGLQLDVQSPLPVWSQTLQSVSLQPLLNKLLPAKGNATDDLLMQLQLSGDADIRLKYAFNGKSELLGQINAFAASAPANLVANQFFGGPSKGEMPVSEPLTVNADSLGFSLTTESSQPLQLTLSPASLKVSNIYTLLPLMASDLQPLATALNWHKDTALLLSWQQPIQISHAQVSDKAADEAGDQVVDGASDKHNTVFNVASSGALTLSSNAQQLSLNRFMFACADVCSLNTDWQLGLELNTVGWPLELREQASVSAKSPETWTLHGARLTGDGHLGFTYSPKDVPGQYTDKPPSGLLSAKLDFLAEQIDADYGQSHQHLSVTEPHLKTELTLGLDGDKLSVHRPALVATTPQLVFSSRGEQISGAVNLNVNLEQLALWKSPIEQPTQTGIVKLTAKALQVERQSEQWNLPLISMEQSLQWQASNDSSGQLTTREQWQLGALTLTSDHQLKSLDKEQWQLTGRWHNQSLLPTLEQMLAATLPAEMWKQYRPRELTLNGMLETHLFAQANFTLPFLNAPLIPPETLPNGETSANNITLHQWQLDLTPNLKITKATKGAVNADNASASAQCFLSSASGSVSCQQLAVTIKTFNPGLPITDIKLDGNVEFDTLGDGGELNIKGQGKLLGGEFLLPQFELSRNNISKAYLVLQGLSLPQLLALQPLQGVTATGIFDGVLPARIEDGKVSVSGGRLAARAPGGLIAVTDNPTVLSLRQSQPHLDFAFNALELLEYSTLARTFDMQPGGEAELKVQIKGRSPGIERPIEFNYNHEENLLQLLQSLQIGNTLQQQLQDSLE